MKRLCIFDFDGTLANSIDLGLSIYNDLAPKYKTLPLKKSEFPRLRKLGYLQVMREKNIRWWIIPKMMKQLTGAMRKRVSEVPTFPGIVTAVKDVQKHGYDIGILTSNKTETVKEFLKRNGFPEFKFVTSETMIFGKHKALRKLLWHYRLSPQAVLYVGDEPRDVMACRKVGIPVIGVTWGIAGTSGFGLYEPDILIDQPKQLTAAIKQLEKEHPL